MSITINHSISGTGETFNVTDGAAHVADIGLPQQAHNRVIATAGSDLPADIATALWTAAEDVRAIRLKVTGGTAGHRIRIVFDASPVDDDSDTTQAATWLAAATPAVSTDVEYLEVTQGGGTGAAGEWTEWMTFRYALRRLDAISVDADVAQTIFIEAY